MNIFTYIKLGLKKLWNSAQCYVPAWMGGGFREELIHVYVWLSHFAVHLKLPQHCQLVIPQYKMLLVLKKIKKNPQLTLLTVKILFFDILCYHSINYRLESCFYN